MAQTPGYDANNTSNVARYAPALLRNRAVTDTYEPGSTFKLVTITGALSDGIVTPSTRFTLPYLFRYGGCYQCSVHDAELARRRSTTRSRRSSPTRPTSARSRSPRSSARRGSRTGSRGSGSASPTGIDFPGESPGFVLPLDQWSDTTIGNVPIGQGISVTPIQMASVYAAVANDGVWIQPHLVERVGGRAPAGAGSTRRLMSPAVDHEVKTMLSGVVSDPGATGTRGRDPRLHRRRQDRHGAGRDGRTATRRPTTRRRSSAWCRRRIRASSCWSRSTTRAARSSAASSPPRRSRRSRSSTCSTSRCRRTRRRRLST